MASALAIWWRSRVLMGRCTVNQVPKPLREEVKQLLRDEGYEWDENGVVIN